MQPEPSLSGNSSSNSKHLQIKLSVDAERRHAIVTILLQNRFSTLIEPELPAFRANKDVPQHSLDYDCKKLSIIS